MFYVSVYAERGRIRSCFDVFPKKNFLLQIQHKIYRNFEEIV